MRSPYSYRLWYVVGCRVFRVFFLVVAAVAFQLQYWGFVLGHQFCGSRNGSWLRFGAVLPALSQRCAAVKHKGGVHGNSLVHKLMSFRVGEIL
jgi:hypothetical protein